MASAKAPPILVRFTGDVFEPANVPMLTRAQKHFETGEVYAIEFADPPSDVTKRHFFAVINDSWKNLSNEPLPGKNWSLADRYPSPEHLRKWAIVKAGYADESMVPCDTDEMADRVVMMARRLDTYCVISRPEGSNVVRIWTAQSITKMDRRTFQNCKTLVFGILSDLIGVEPHTLAAQGQVDTEEDDRNPIQEPTESLPGPADPDTERQPPMRPAPATEPATPILPAEPPTPPPAEPPATQPAGALTRVAAMLSDGVAHSQDAPGETQESGGGDPPPTPKNYDQYLAHIRVWLGFVTDAKRVKLKYYKEQTDWWPKFNPRLTEFQERYFDKLVTDKIKELT